MNNRTITQQVIEKMKALDYYSQWLGIKIVDIQEGYSRMQITVRKEMLNCFGIVHGGVTFSLADSALAFACNSNGKITLALNADISFTQPAKENDTLTAEAKELNKTNKTGLYLVEVKNQHGQLIALFRGTCYRTEKDYLTV